MSAPRLRWRTMGEGYHATTAEGWEYRIRYAPRGFVTEARSGETWALVWSCATLPQAKFAAYNDARTRRWKCSASPHCSRTEVHVHCPECGSTEHVAANCDMEG